MSLGSIPDDDPEVKAVAKVYATLADVQFCPLVEYFKCTSSWYNLKKSVAWILRYCENLRKASKSTRSCEPVESTQSQSLQCITVDEMKTAEVRILKCVQLHHFNEEFNSLNKSENVKKSSCLRRLDPIVVDGLILVGGRLNQAKSSFDAKHQIILPKNEHVSSLIIDPYHKLSAHSGRQHVFSLIREKYWIINANSAVRRALANCYGCSRRESPVCEQKMADLPEDRLVPDKPPFTSVGIDRFGPFEVRRCRGIVKIRSHLHMPDCARSIY